MNKKQAYITEEEREKCQKVVDAFAELFKCEDLTVINAGKYGFIKLQHFRTHLGFDNAFSFNNSRSLFNDLWDEWVGTQIDIASDTPMEEMDYEDKLECLPQEKQKEFINMRKRFAEKAGIGDMLEKTAQMNCLTTNKRGEDNTNKGMKKTKSLLDLFVRMRTYKVLDRTAEKNRSYRATLREQEMAYDELQKAGLTKEQKRIVDKALCALNANGRAYGKAAYRLGLHDGIRLMLEENKLSSLNS